MKHTKRHQCTEQSTQVSQSTRKQDVNLQKNTLVYFQIGLIICLLGTYALLEMQTRRTSISPEALPTDNGIIEVAMTDVKLELVKKIEPKKERVRSTQIIDTIKVIDDTLDTPEGLISTPKPENEPVVSIASLDTYDLPDEVSIMVVSKVPIFPGCEQYTKRDDLTKCMSDKISKVVRRNFKTSLAEGQGLKGLQKIDVQFKIDTDGNVVDIKARAPHSKLEDEAIRVIDKLPQMTPGYQGEQPVRVVYYLPIKFQIRD